MEENKSDLTQELHSFFTVHFNYSIKTRLLKQQKLYKSTFKIFNQLFFKAIRTFIKCSSEFPNHTLKQVIESLTGIFYKLEKFLVMNSQRSAKSFILHSIIDSECFKMIIEEINDHVLGQIRIDQDLIRQVQESELFKALDRVGNVIRQLQEGQQIQITYFQQEIRPLVDQQKYKNLLEIRQKIGQYRLVIEETMTFDPLIYLGIQKDKKFSTHPAQDFFDSLLFIQNLKITKELQQQFKDKFTHKFQQLETTLDFPSFFQEYITQTELKQFLDLELCNYLRKIYSYLRPIQDKIPKKFKKLIIQQYDLTSSAKVWPQTFQPKDETITIDLTQPLSEANVPSFILKDRQDLTIMLDQQFPYIRQKSLDQKAISVTIRIPRDLKIKMNKQDIVRINNSDFFYVLAIEDHYQRFKLKNAHQFFDFQESFTNQDFQSIDQMLSYLQKSTFEPQQESSNQFIEMRFKPTGCLENNTESKVHSSKKQLKIGRYQDKELPYVLDIQYKPNKMNVSEEQCLIEFLGDGGYCISDDKSEHGSFYYLQGRGKEHVEPHEIALFNGMELLVGKFKYVFRLE